MATRLVCTPRTVSASQRAAGKSAAVSLGFRQSGTDDAISSARRLIEARAGAAAVSPAVIAVVKSNYWGKGGARLTTSFMDSPSKELRREILRHLNMWSSRANVQFVESTTDPMVRIDRRTGPDWGGYWSYVGTDILGIKPDEPTMNLEGFTMSTSASEFRRVVCHEAGHTLGFPHEHMRKELVGRIDPAKAYAYFRRTDGWSPKDVDEQVLTPLGTSTIFGTPPDQTSIMCYQLPGSIMRDGKPILGGNRINETDYQFAAAIYPRPKASPVRSAPRRKSTAATTRKKKGTKNDMSRRAVKLGTTRRATKRGRG